MTPMRAIMVGPLRLDDQEQGFDGGLPLLKILLGLRHAITKMYLRMCEMVHSRHAAEILPCECLRSAGSLQREKNHGR